MRYFLICVMIFLCIAAVPVLAGNPDPNETGTAKSVVPKPGTNVEGKMAEIYDVLFMFLVLSVVFEVALTPLFNWRVFMARFEGQGYKTPITVILAFIVFWHYDLDIVGDLLVAMGKNVTTPIGGKILTALLIAGGSSGVYQVFKKLHINMATEEREKKAKDAKDAKAQKDKEREEAKRKQGQNQE